MYVFIYIHIYIYKLINKREQIKTKLRTNKTET